MVMAREPKEYCANHACKSELGDHVWAGLSGDTFCSKKCFEACLPAVIGGREATAERARSPEITGRIDWSDKERAALAELMVSQCLSEHALLRQALALYQLHTTRLRNGETCTWSGDAQRAAEFAGAFGALQSPTS